MTFSQANKGPEIISRDHIVKAMQDWNSLTQGMRERMTGLSLRNTPLNAHEKELLERMKKVEELEIQGKTKLQFCMNTFHSGIGIDMKTTFDEAMERYNEAVSIKLDIVAANGNPELEQYVDDLIGKYGEKDPRIIVLQKLKKLTKGLESGKSPFLQEYSSKGKKHIAANFEKMQEVSDLLGEMERSGAYDPSITQFLRSKLGQSMHVHASADPIRAQFWGINQTLKQMGPNMGYGPLRVIGALGAGIIATFGLTGYLYQKIIKKNENAELSWLIPAWFGGAVGIVNPYVFASKDQKAIKALKETPWHEVRTMKANGLSVDVAKEVDVLTKNKKGDELLKKENISMAELAQVLGIDTEEAMKQNPLMQFLTKIAKNDKTRAMVLRKITGLQGAFGKKAFDDVIQNG